MRTDNRSNLSLLTIQYRNLSHKFIHHRKDNIFSVLSVSVHTFSMQCCYDKPERLPRNLEAVLQKSLTIPIAIL